MKDKLLIVNPLENDIVSCMTKVCGKMCFDVLYTDMLTDEQSVGKIVNGKYDILIFHDMKSRVKSDMLIDMINYGYLAGKGILAVTDSMSFIHRLEAKLGSTIKELKNVKYVMMPIDQEDLGRRLNQLSSSMERKTTQQIFNELQCEIVKAKNTKRSRLTQLVECII